MVPDPRISAGFASLLVFLVTVHPLQGQYLPEGAEDWYLMTDDGHRVYVVELGPSTPAPDTVVVLHGGWGAEHSYLWPAVQPLADRYHFVLYDQRGSLRSPPADSTLSVGRLVADLDELRRELGGERLTILGHSMGARLATAYLSEHPERVRRLVLVSPPLVLPEGGGPVDTAEVRRARERFGEFHQEQTARQMVAEGFDAEQDPATSRESTDRWRIAFTAANVFHVERWRKMRGGMAFYNSEVARPVNENTPEPLSGQAHYHRALREAEVPVRIILGDHDFVDFGLVAWPKIVEEMLNVELETLEIAGHAVWMDRPDAFQAALLRALEGGPEVSH
jgi:proline iminopeptidase